MPMQIEYKKEFTKYFNKAPAKVQLAFKDSLRIFMANQFDPLLNNHPLTGKYQGKRSINITGNWRAIFREFENYRLVIFETLGTHSQLYKK